MEYRCYKCGKIFDERGKFITHLRINHLLKDHDEAINCAIVGCTRTYLTFRGLSTHLKSCERQAIENVMLFHTFT